MEKRLYTRDEAEEIGRLARIEMMAGSLFIEHCRRSTVTLTLENARDQAVKAIRIAEVFVNVLDDFQSHHLRRLRGANDLETEQDS